jgi:CRISPR/Cas system-associated exonuclease Cas4 (RecB family)
MSNSRTTPEALEAVEAVIAETRRILTEPLPPPDRGASACCSPTKQATCCPVSGDDASCGCQ